MATQVQLRRGNTSQTNAFTGAVAEITIDTDKETIVVHDGSTAGGFPLARESALSTNLTFTQAAFNAANAAGSSATVQAAFDKANSANVLAQAAFDAANTVSPLDSYARTTANAAFTQANTATTLAQAAFNKANTSVDAVLTSTVDTFTGDGSTVAYTLSTTPATINYTTAVVGGVTQPRSAYSVIGTTLTFTSAPANTQIIEVTTIGTSNTTLYTVNNIISPFLLMGA